MQKFFRQEKTKKIEKRCGAGLGSRQCDRPVGLVKRERLLFEHEVVFDVFDAFYASRNLVGFFNLGWLRDKTA